MKINEVIYIIIRVIKKYFYGEEFLNLILVCNN